MRLEGTVISYNKAQRFGYIRVEGYKEILYGLTDLPVGYIAPHIGEQLNFELNEVEGVLYASHIQRPDIQVPTGYKAKIKSIQHQMLMLFYSYSQTVQKQILVGLVAVSLLLTAWVAYGLNNTYQTYQQNKAQQFLVAQQQAVEAQRTALGEIEEIGLSEQAKRNLDGQVYGSVKERSETISRGIDKLNGLQPLSSGRFKCDERKQCHEMRSYEEALYFQRNCRGTKLDNNGNGIPCENDIRWIKK